MDVSVVVPVFNGSPWLVDQLRALAAQDTPLRWELVVSDNGSTDGSQTVVRQASGEFHRLLLVDASATRGAAHARNAGAWAASGALLLFCDSDDVVDRFWIHAMHRAAKSAGLLAGRLDYEALNTSDARRWREPVQSAGVPNFYGQPYAVSANFGIAAPLFEQLGGFDETFPAAGGEDVDLPVRAGAQGAEVAFVPDGVVQYRLKTPGSAALRQAAVYGAASALLMRRHPALFPPTSVGDDLSFVAEAAVDQLRTVVHRGSSRQQLWRLYYHAARTRARAGEADYWRLRRRYPPTPMPSHRSLLTAIRVVRRRTASASRGSAPPGPITPWSAIGQLRQGLDPTGQHLLGAGLLSTADITLEVQRGDRTWFVNPAMDPIVSGVLSSGGYSEDEVDVVEAALAQDATTGRRLVVNIGANVGTTAVPLAERGWRVLAVEPVPRAVELLRRNLKANGVDDVVDVVAVAVVHERGPVEMVAGDNLSTSEVRRDQAVEELATPGDVRAGVISVDGWPLLPLLEHQGVDLDEVALVWSDTEGGEAAVIETGAELWARGVPLWVEVRPSALLDQGTITGFCALVEGHFSTFQTAEDLAAGVLRPVDRVRDFVDSVGYGRWAFTNVLLRP